MSEKIIRIEESPERIFAIGDIHGCLDETVCLLEFLAARRDLSENDLVVFIGDYIDRGPDSRDVVEYLIRFKKRFPGCIFLKGNHEDMLLDYLGLGGTGASVYLHNGGAETLESYGFPAEMLPDDIVEEFPKQHLSFFLNLERMVLVDDFVLVHAGVNPLRELDVQLDHDLFWIRNEFIQNIHRFEKTVVFGHTCYRDVLFDLPYKIGIDTGLVYSNLLSCIELRSEEVLQVGRRKTVVRESSFSKKLSGKPPRPFFG